MIIIIIKNKNSLLESLKSLGRSPLLLLQSTPVEQGGHGAAECLLGLEGRKEVKEGVRKG